LGDQIKKNELDGERRMYVGEERYIPGFGESTEKDHLED
jgi:hypothetical protein